MCPKLVIDHRLDSPDLSSPSIADYSDDRFRDLGEFILKSMDISTSTCKDNEVVILDRSRTRRLLNIDELKNVSLSLGYENITVIKFENMSIKEQIQAVHCASMFFYVNGAAIVHGLFMRPGTNTNHRARSSSKTSARIYHS